MLRTTSYVQSQTVLRALEFTLSKGGFTDSDHQKKTAQSLVKDMKSSKSVSGRHQQLTALLKRGVSVEEMIKVTHSSRRTIFRYLNHLEEAGLNLELLGGKYKLK